MEAQVVLFDDLAQLFYERRDGEAEAALGVVEEDEEREALLVV